MTAVHIQDLSFGSFEGISLGVPECSIEDEAGYRAAIWKPLPRDVDSRISSDLDRGVVRSWKPFGPPKSDFAYVQVTHIDMRGQSKTGELVVHKDLALEVALIALDIFSARFPIEQMRLIDYWDADDDRSMRFNNSSALCVRQITGGGKLSLHSLGRAVDINTLLNPYFKRTEERDIIAPIEGAKFIDRSLCVPGMIRDGDAVVRAFDARGWEWGGRWVHPSPCDWQHFQKKPPDVV